jgi:hypothetical protein
VNYPTPFAETSLTLVAAVFDRRAAAERAVATLRHRGGSWGTVEFVSPGERALGRKFEPDTAGIGGTALRSHLVFGALGPLLGLLVAAVLVQDPGSLAAQEPLWVAFTCALLGGFAGLIVAGLLTLRPDHGIVIEAVSEQVDDGAWAVIVRPRDGGSARRAFKLLQDHGGEAYRSF